jgi:hypothetical protein
MTGNRAGLAARRYGAGVAPILTLVAVMFRSHSSHEHHPSGRGTQK